MVDLVETLFSDEDNDLIAKGLEVSCIFTLLRKVGDYLHHSSHSIGKLVEIARTAEKYNYKYLARKMCPIPLHQID